MSKNLLLSLFTLIFIVACNHQNTEKKSNDQYKKSKLTIEQIELQNPLRFLEVDGKDKHNLIGQTVVKGEITNKATVVTFKDISVSIKFISKTGAVLEEDEEVIYEEVKPGSNINFKSKFFAPKGTEDVKMKIIKAVSVH
jgi:uncharacterized lipoprotein